MVYHTGINVKGKLRLKCWPLMVLKLNDSVLCLVFWRLKALVEDVRIS